MVQEDVNKLMLVTVRLALHITLWSYIFDSLSFERSVYGWIGGVSIVVAIIATHSEQLARLGASACSIAEKVYKFLLSPLTRDYKEKEANYKEIIRGLQRELSKD